jgi:hypothetical protein
MPNSHEEIQNSFNIFKKRIIEIDYLQGTVKDTHEKKLKELEQRTKNEENTPHKSWRHTNFWIRNIGQGRPEHCESNEFNTQETFDLVTELFNKQYQVLLVDAYEAFEKYINTANSELSKIDTQFSTKKKLDILKFLKKLHNTTPQIDLIINMRNEQDSRYPDKNRTLFLITLIERLRHHIVHSYGFVMDKQKLIDEIMQEIGLFNNGNYNQNYTNEFNYYFGINLHLNRICLLEVYDSETPQVFNTYQDRLGNLIKELISYTKFINGYILMRIKTASGQS